MRSFLVVAVSAAALALPLVAQSMTGQDMTSQGTTGRSSAGEPAAPPPGPQAPRNAPSPLAHAGSSDATPICKTYTPTGTHFARKECHTRAEWDRMAADARNTLNDSAHPNPGGPH